MGGYPDAGIRAELFFREMLERGFIIAPQGFIVLSTAMTETDIDRLIEESLAALRTIKEKTA